MVNIIKYYIIQLGLQYIFKVSNQIQILQIYEKLFNEIHICFGFIVNKSFSFKIFNGNMYINNRD